MCAPQVALGRQARRGGVQRIGQKRHRGGPLLRKRALPRLEARVRLAQRRRLILRQVERALHGKLARSTLEKNAYYAM